MRTAVLLCLLLLVVLPCCDDDDGGFKPEPTFREPTSPENVLHNLAACHKEMDFEHYVPLIHEAFHFIFWPDDLPDIPPAIFPDGVWFRESMLYAARNMFDTTYVICDLDDRTKSTTMTVGLYQGLEETNIEGAPSGTLQGRAYLELRVDTVGGLTFQAYSAPIFYFAPDSSPAYPSGDVTWQIWRIEDCGSTPSLRLSPWAGTPVPIEYTSWGIVLTLYATRGQ